MAMKKCKECLQLISSKADKCPHCGSPQKMKFGCFTTITILLMVSVGISMISNGFKQEPQPVEAAQKPPKPAKAALPFKIVEDERKSTDKRSVVVVLDKRVDESTLVKYANQIKGLTSTSYRRTYINYYLKDQDRGGVSWATSHFNPNLEVSIFGITQKQKDTLTAKAPAAPNQNVIGVWLNEDIGGRYTLYEKGSTLFMEMKFSDGSSSTSEMIDLPMQRARRVEEKAGNPHGEYYIINQLGQLEFWGSNGKFYTARGVR